ncbi:hypothetical protein AS594_35325 [Streptomyces agglomeratus]|uniref:Uncharacterized protein n=1 Tax=Streptomyces agglomeratus TaxID=285458 RepID=A0A1E5PHR4_9ACTN|nr:hypothetical protein [Streptomyces agglomeratus]OEJ28914.1 hypothetical protein AS594_35325 [Streptomyces agglomeratus]
MVLQRGDLVLTYTVAGPEALASIVEHPEVVAHADSHRRTGVNVASFTLAALRGEGVRGWAMQAPYPRLWAQRPGAVAAAGRDPAAAECPGRLAALVGGRAHDRGPWP